MVKAVLLLTLVVVVGSTPSRRSLDGAGVKYEAEEQCLREGGICGLASQCPSGRLHPEAGLCPRQQALGVECCFGVTHDITDCRARGGECVAESACGRAPREAVGECEPGEVCCVFMV